MKITKQQYIFIFLTALAIILEMVNTVTGTAGERICYEQRFGNFMSFSVFEKMLSWSFMLGLFLMTATRAQVSVWVCVIFFLLMIIPALIHLNIYCCANTPYIMDKALKANF